jgi:hypothetical protein
MHKARLAKSARLQRVLKLLVDGQEHSTMEIIQACQVCAVNSIMAEIRANGIPVTVRRHGGKWLYRLGR